MNSSARARSLASSKSSRARRRRAVAAIALAAIARPSAAYAHAFGQQFVLPLPIAFYLYGGAAAVVVSFLAIAVFSTGGTAALRYRTLDITHWPLAGWATGPAARRALQLIASVTLLAVILAGLVGQQVPSHNFASLIVWIIGYLGIAYFSAIAGDLWSAASPFRAFARFAEPRNRMPYPRWLGYLPAVGGLYAFIWLEVLSETASEPRTTVLCVVLYYSMCLVGTACFGVSAWFGSADFLSVFFGLLGRLSIFERRDGRLYLRSPFVGALSGAAVRGSLAFFILLMLASTAFDGFRETLVWSRWMRALPGVVDSAKVRLFVETAALALAPAVWFAAYALAIAVMKRITRTPLSMGALIGRFALTLLPIALAYHFAHYFTLLFVQGQSVFGILADPFGQGWNLFGQSADVTAVVMIGARAVWNIQVTAILAGHIGSVYLAHRVALDLFPAPGRAAKSQVPMLGLMVGYTVLGLWILAQPMNPAR